MLAWQVTCFRIMLQKLPVSNLTVPRSDYKSLIRNHALEQWQIRWNSESENKLHAIKPRENVFNLFRLPRRDEIIIHRLSIGTHILHIDPYVEMKLPLGAWLVKSI